MGLIKHAAACVCMIRCNTGPASSSVVCFEQYFQEEEGGRADAGEAP